MYIGGVGSTGLHHLVWEILDNSIDEAMNGYASNISVTLHDDGASITVADDGRGIPVDKHPKTKKSALEVIFTTLHAGGKFEHGSYKTAGGLHGVGASVVNALSKELVATVKRDGATWEQRFKQGVPVGVVKKVGPARGTGTTVFFRPDATIFPEGRVRSRGDQGAARGRQLPAQGRADRVRGRKQRREGGLPALRGAGRLPEEDRDRAIGDAGARGAVRAHARERRERHPSRHGAAVDAVDRRARAQLRQRHSDRLRRHPRERVPRGARQGGPEFHRDPQPVAERA